MNATKLLLLLLAAAAVALFFALDADRLLTLESLQANRQALVDFSRRHTAAAVALFLGIYILQTALSLPGAAVLSLAAGAVFGFLPGAVLVNLGATTGATFAFLLARTLFREPVRRKFGHRLEKLNRELEREGLGYLLFLRLVPAFPFFLVNLGAGLTSLPLRSYILGTALGIVPGSLVFVNAGASLAAVDSIGEIASPRVIGAFVLLGLFALAPALVRKIHRREDE